MKTLLLSTSVLAISLLSTAATAGVAETKAMNASKETFKEYTDRMNTACGGSATASVDWAPVDNYDFAKLERDKANVISTATDVASEFLSHLASICSDADYKAAISKVSTISFTPVSKGDASASGNSVKLEGSTLSISFAPIKSDLDAYGRLKKAF